MESCKIKFYGRVLDGETGEAVPGASVSLQGLNTGALADRKGAFVISGLCPGSYVVLVSNYGYKNGSYPLQLKDSVYMELVLAPDITSLDSVIIKVVKEETENTQPVSVITGRELDRLRGLSLGEVVRTLPGVSAIQTGPSIFKPVIQGMYSNRVLIMNNGVRLEGQQWGIEHAPEVDPFLAGSISVVKGASGVRYGPEAIGGVVVIEPRELRKEAGWGGQADLGGFSNNRAGAASAFLDHHSGKWPGLSLRVQGTLKRGGNFKTPGYYLKNTGLEEKNFSWTARYSGEKAGAEVFYSLYTSSSGIFSASHSGNLTDLDRAIRSPVPLERSGFSYKIQRPYQEALHELTRVRAYYKPGKLGKLDVTLARQYNQRMEYDKHPPLTDSLKDSPQAEFRITTHSASATFTHYRAGNFTGEAGINVSTQGNTTGGTSRSFIPNFRSWTPGVYMMERWKHRRLEAEAGWRYDVKWMKAYLYENDLLVSPDYRFAGFSGTLGAIYIINDHLTAGMNFGRAFRAPSPNELFSDGLHHGAARIETGDRNLAPEISYSTTASLKFRFSRCYGELSLYNNEIKDYIYLAPVIVYDPATAAYTPEYKLTIRGAFPVFQYRQVHASFTGADLSFNDSLSKNFVWSTKLSLLRAYNRTSGTYLILTPPANMENGIRYSFSIPGKMTDTYVSLSHLLVFRKSKVPVYEDLTPPPPAYIVFAAEAGCTFKAGGLPVTFTFSVYNLFNTRYRNYLDRFRYFSDATGRNLVLRIRIPIGFSKQHLHKK